MTSGVLAGAFLLYAHTVMPALRQADDRAFVDTFRRLDRAIINPVFMLTGFLGAPALTLAAALTTDGDVRRWTYAALALHLLMVLITGAVNVPRNDALKAAPPDADPTEVRTDFNELRWARWNLLRVLISCSAAIALAWALVVAQPA
ncbi:DUF1772 domain-containing protein [Nocardioides marmoriginsengisoli]|uniref:DUF1772 domain-containing protein n=1 Tax=Nocardioides marmoriginsengisoli TaxID=661483 RepID=A0A3N0CK44_9ACTN|nr:DUF1772 domain-containing protein [Nocardioides marmoriginsengisoli]